MPDIARFHPRKGAKFHDGRGLIPANVIASIKSANGNALDQGVE